MEQRAAARHGLQIKSARGFFCFHRGELLMRAIGSVDRCCCDIEAKLAQAAYLLKKKRMGDAGIAAEKVTETAAVPGWLALSIIHVLINLCAGLQQAYVLWRNRALRLYHLWGMRCPIRESALVTEIH
jgi:hypothetical protein